MAVYEGARPRTIAPQRSRSRAARASPRARRSAGDACARPSGPAGGRNHLGLVLGAIVVAFLLAFFSLAQVVRVSATEL